MEWEKVFQNNLEELINNKNPHYDVQPRHSKGTTKGGQWKDGGSAYTEAKKAKEKPSKSGGKEKSDKKTTGKSGKAWEDSLSKQEKSALHAYSTAKYQAINSGLRSGKLSASDKKTVDAIDSALGKSGLPSDSVLYENQKLYRAANIPEVAAVLKKKGNLEGMTFKDKAFVSTTKDLSVANNFMRGNAQLFVIHAPKGTKAANIDSFSALNIGKGESEVLMARNTTFKVNKVEKVKEKYKTRDLKGKTVTRTRTRQYIHLDVVSQ